MQPQLKRKLSNGRPPNKLKNISDNRLNFDQFRIQSNNFSEKSPSVQTPKNQTEQEIIHLRETVEMLNKTITQNKIFLYMVIHDLKHPTESMISQLNAMHLSLIDQIQTINTITERQERIEKFTTDLLLNRKASTNLNASIMEP